MTESGGAAAGRSFEHAGARWVVIDGGRSLAGSDRLAPIGVRLIQFARPEDPATPVLEATAPPRPVDDLHDAELVDLIRTAREVPVYAPPGEAGQQDRRVRSGGPSRRDRGEGRRRN